MINTAGKLIRRTLLAVSLCSTFTGGKLLAADWKKIDTLIDEQKVKEAETAVLAILAESKGKSDADWTRSLITLTQIRIGLHSYETAVKELKDAAWPKATVSRAVVEFYYAQALATYLEQYSWEIRQREKTASDEAFDLKKWTANQIFKEALEAYNRIWAVRSSLGELPISEIKTYIEPNNYPPNIRGTLRDLTTYKIVESLTNTANWRAAETNELFKLSLPDLLIGKSKIAAGHQLQDVTDHPVEKIVHVLKDLESWHYSKKNDSAALDARFTAFTALHQVFTDAIDQKLIRTSFSSYLKAHENDPWSAHGTAELAELQQNAGELVAADSRATACLKKYKSELTQRCQYIVASIEMPSYQVNSMALDALDKNSIEIRHKNLKNLYFRAYKINLTTQIKQAKDYNLLPAYREYETLIKTTPDFSWSVDLPATPDFKDHKTFASPKTGKHGFYVVISSATPDFKAANNLLQAFNINLSDLVILHETVPGGIAATILDGKTGAPVSGAEVNLYKFDYKSGHSLVRSGKTDKIGKSTFNKTDPQSSYFIVVSKNNDIGIQSNYIYAYRERKKVQQNNTLIYTDRAVYRPKQEIQWKIIAYTNTENTADHKVAANTKINIILRDGNYQEIAKVSVKTNSFGTASGSFTIPEGRLLGQWQITSTFGNTSKWFQVEEYKRPTFELSFQEIKDDIRLNTKAEVTGEARYYFGGPVSDAKLVYRISRTPIFPWWWHFYYWNGGGQATSQMVSSGSAVLTADGSFKISFVPEARLPTNKTDWSKQYRYEVTVDVTDAGGETRSGSTHLTAGFVTVQADISNTAPLCFAEENCTFSVVRQNLNGFPVAGSGTYKIVQLIAPKNTPAPSELPINLQKTNAETGEANYFTKGDGERPRWEHQPTSDEYLSHWQEGSKVSEGQLQHPPNGAATITVQNISAGAYKIFYATKDSAGKEFETWRYFVAAAAKGQLALPLLLEFDRSTAKIGEKIRLYANTGFSHAQLSLRLYHNRKVIQEIPIKAGSNLIEFSIGESMRGGISASLEFIYDHQFFQQASSVYIPWDNKEISVNFEKIKDTMQPGAEETITVKVKGANGKERSAEVLAFMYDKSLDLIAVHGVSSPFTLFPALTGTTQVAVNLRSSPGTHFQGDGFTIPHSYLSFHTDQLMEISQYGLGGAGRRSYKKGMLMRSESSPPAAAPMEEASAESDAEAPAGKMDASKASNFAEPAQKPAAPVVQMRENFAETAFFIPAATTDNNGVVSFKFTLPDSLTSWHLWAVGLMKDFSSGIDHKEVRTAKDLMARMYVPRFFREGDQTTMKVVVNNTTKSSIKGSLKVTLTDEISGQDLAKEFGLQLLITDFTVQPDGSESLAFSVKTPPGSRRVKIKAVATAGVFSDGEVRTLPVLPGRMHLVQSRFVALKNQTKKTITFADLKKGDDASRINEKIAVTIDGQLFFSTLKALPYLIEFPYECSEQTLNRFLSAGIMSSLFKQNPSLEKAAADFSKRQSEYQPWQENDPNSRMQLEESPWLSQANGGKGPSDADLINLLKSENAKKVRDLALAKLQKSQTASGGFPWFPGGAPSPFMTLYLTHGFAKAQEFDVAIPPEMVKKSWQYLATHFKEVWADEKRRDPEFLTFLNFTASSFKEQSVFNEFFGEKDRKEVLDYSFKHWKNHAPYLKFMLSLTLHRMNRPKDAKLVLDSIMDSATTSEETGTSWTAEDRSWLWYNDTIETHAFALRALTEMQPKNPATSGLVHWLFLNKKLSQWKSTRATAEVIYSIAHWLKSSGDTYPDENLAIEIGPIKKDVVFSKNQYSGPQFIEVAGPAVTGAMADISFQKKSGNLMFASATWHYSTEKMPDEGRGDFFFIDRKYFVRKAEKGEITLTPVDKNQKIEVGDEIEVQISIRSKHAAEYVHLRDPRPAGFEPVTMTSGHKWDLGLSWFEEIRDNGTNFFFEWIPVGEYTFKYRLRVANAGVFRAMPAEIQSMYAPEFNAFSSGREFTVKNDGFSQ